jgi:signal transduction histidine kinase
VTFASPRSGGSFIVDDGDSGVYVATADATSRGLPKPDQDFEGEMQTGMKVEVTGISARGGFAPVIIPHRIRHLGNAPLPPPKSVSVADLQTGRLDCERVRVRGVVQHVELTDRQIDAVQLELAAVGGHFVGYAMKSAGFEVSQLVDAEVDLIGVALSFFNERAELVGTRVQLQGIEDVATVRAATSSPFAAPEVSLDALLPFSPEAPSLHRRKLSGVVTVCRPGDYFYVQEGDRAVRINTRDSAPLVPGDRVEVSGFIELWQSFAEVREAVFRKTGSASVPEAELITRDEVLAYRPWLERSPTASHFDGKRVALRGRLEKVEETDRAGRRLSLDCDGHIVFATLANDEPREALSRLVAGSEVSVVGACQVELSVGRPTLRNPVPTSFQLLVHSPADVTVLRVPPWWTPRRLWLALGGTSAVLALALTWAWLLRRRVTQRSSELAAEIGARRNAAVEFDATLRERKRLAADLHDTLEQALTGLALQLEAVDMFGNEEPDRSRHHLHLARQFLARSREDVRRSVWNLRAQGLEGRTLDEALQQMVATLTDSSGVRSRCGIEGDSVPLPDFIAGNLLLLAQEGVTNALKHSSANRIDVGVEYSADGVSLRIEDDGCGFNPGTAPGLREGHFGLQGMRERVKRLGGTIDIASAIGQGCRINATVPTRVFDAAVEV